MAVKFRITFVAEATIDASDERELMELIIKLATSPALKRVTNIQRIITEDVVDGAAIQ